MRRNRVLLPQFALSILAALMLSRESQASNPYLEVPAAAEIEASGAYRYANASDDQVRFWIAERELPFVELPDPIPGVRLAGRLTGALHGVWIHGADIRHIAESPYEILDGRLALALDDFCKILNENAVVELEHLSIYRPKVAATQPQTRHPGALAIDLGAIKQSDGNWLRVKRDFPPAIGAKTCGAGSVQADSAAGQLLQRILCEARRRGIFHYALTPHFDAAHADHFHLEIKPVVKWYLYN